ncbi:hypothetical protein DMENIID0001_075210 [Sergentomyia squamirostris]
MKDSEGSRSKDRKERRKGRRDSRSRSRDRERTKERRHKERSRSLERDRRSRSRSKERKERRKGRRDSRSRSRDRERTRERRHKERSRSREREHRREGRNHSRSRDSRSRSRDKRSSRDKERRRERERPDRYDDNAESGSTDKKDMPMLSQQILAAVGSSAADKNFASFLSNSFLSGSGGGGGGFDTSGSGLLSAYGLGSMDLGRDFKFGDSGKDMFSIPDATNGSGMGFGNVQNRFMSHPPDTQSNSNSQDGLKGILANPDSNDSTQENSNAADERKRKRKSRWAGGDHDKTFIPGMPTILPASLSADQQEAYLVQLQIEEISRKLRSGDLGISQNPEERFANPKFNIPSWTE